MRALVWDGETAKVTTCADPADERLATVRVRLAGVCATDLEITRGYMDYRGVLGHEFVGTVESGPDEWLGKRVVGEINIGCGACRACDEGLGRHCPNRTVVGIVNANGAFAERVALPVENLHQVPDNVSDEEAVFAEPLAAAFEILEQITIEPAHRCLVFGDGRLGLLISQVLSTTGAHITAVGKHDDKLALLSQRGIETQKLDAFDEAPTQADIVVDATGAAAGFERAMAATRPRGILVLKSTVATPTKVDLSPLVINEINVVGSRCGPFGPALKALAEQSVDVRPLIAERFPLASADLALKRAGEPGMLKVLIDCA